MEIGNNNQGNLNSQNDYEKYKNQFKCPFLQKHENNSQKDNKRKIKNIGKSMENNQVTNHNFNLLFKNGSSSSKSIKKEEYEKALTFRKKLSDKKFKNSFQAHYSEIKKDNKESKLKKNFIFLKTLKKEKEMEIVKNKLKDLFNKEDENKMKNLLKEKDENGNKEEELNNQNDINTKNKLLIEKPDEINSLKKENLTKEYNEMKSTNENLIKFEDLIEKKEHIKTMEKDISNENNISKSSNYTEINNEQLERNKINQSMDIGISRYPRYILDFDKQNECNDLLNSNDNTNQLLYNKRKTSHILLNGRSDKKETNIWQTYSKLNSQDSKNIKCINENNIIEIYQKNKKASFNLAKNLMDPLDNDIKFNFKDRQKKEKKIPLKGNINVLSKVLNSSEKKEQNKNIISEDIKIIEKKRNEENNSNLELSLESDKDNKKLKIEKQLKFKLGKKKEEENKKELNDENENMNKELSEDNDENINLKEEIKKNIREDLKANIEEIEKLKEEKADLISKNKLLNEENEKMNQKIKDNNEELNKEKENYKTKLKNFKEVVIKLKDEIKNLKEKNQEIIKEKEEIYNELDKEKEINDKINKEKEEIKNKLYKEKEKNEKINKEKEEINNELNKEKEKNEKINKEKEEINNELYKEKEKNKEINSLKIENKELNEKNILLNKENESIKLELNKGIDEKKNLIEEKEKFYEENLKSKIVISQYDTENKNLISKNNELEKQLNELKLLFEQNQIQQNEILINIMNNNPLILYNKPTLIGLNNIGATCFMNSTLQCLSQTKELTSYFLKPKNKNEIINNNIALENMNNNQLCPVFLELIQKLWDRNGQKSFSPNKFMNTVNEINSLFKTGQAGDAKDFIIFVLEQLHKELKKPINSNNNNLISEQLNQYDKNNSLNHFFKDFKNELSIISDIFYGFNETTNECMNCKNIYNFKGLNNNPICYNYGIFNCLIFPLEEVKNFKYNNNYTFNNFCQINNCVSLYDCFQYNQKTELFTGQNRNYCNICKQLFDSYYTSKIYICPTVLILILNRGKGNIYNIKLFFDEIIDITEFVLQKESTKIVYNLYGVITHIGQSGPNAHFVASCKSPIDNKWYRYNDSFVNPIENVQKEIIDFGTPYILFYHKQNS